MKRIYYILVALMIGIIVSGFRVSHYQGRSMEPTLTEGYAIHKGYYGYNRGDIITFEVNDYSLIKRVIAIPGDTVEVINGVCLVNGVEKFEVEKSDTYYDLGVDEYFVVGDNLGESFDSVIFGKIKSTAILGKVLFTVETSDIKVVTETVRELIHKMKGGE